MIDNGGPAFPAPSTYSVHGDYEQREYGMSLRDWFAGQALAGLVIDAPLGEPRSTIAEQAYELADAMLKARA